MITCTSRRVASKYLDVTFDIGVVRVSMGLLNATEQARLVRCLKHITEDIEGWILEPETKGTKEP